LIELYNALYQASYDYVIDEPEDRLINEFAVYVNDRRDLKIYGDMISNLRLAPYFNDFFFPDIYEFNRKIVEEGEYAAAAIASVKDSVQANLDEIFKQK